MLGTHFFSPANVMRLLEIVRGKATSYEALATAVALGRRLGKVPVVVGVCYGFVGNRMLMRRGVEAERLLVEGALPHEVEAALTEFGLPMGPFAMGDLAGLDVSWRIRKGRGETALDRGRAVRAGTVRAEDRQRLVPLRGRLACPGARPRGRAADRRDLGEAPGQAAQPIAPEEIVERLTFPMINEGARILEEGIASRPGDIDVIWVYGYGWPVWRGGPMFYADLLGLAHVRDRLAFYAERSGDASLEARRPARPPRRRRQGLRLARREEWLMIVPHRPHPLPPGLRSGGAPSPALRERVDPARSDGWVRAIMTRSLAMDLRFTPEELAFRDEVRDFFRSALPPAIRTKMVEGRHLAKDDIIAWQRVLNQKGWAVTNWPKKWGGTNWTPVQQYIYQDELQQAPAPPPLGFGVTMVGPVIIAFGSEAQKQHYLPRIANLDDWWCQGFSEPGSGSDLASLRTAARRENGHYIVNGQKTWTTLAQYADWIFVLARTDREAKKQEGISFLLIDMKTPGITVRPIVTIEGGHEVNEVFFDDVKVPAENLVGEENKGWDYAKYLLGRERTGIARVGASKERVRRIKELAAIERIGDRPLIEDERFREKLAELEVELKALEMTQLRVVAAERHRNGNRPDPRLLDPQDQGLGDPAAHHRIAAGSRRPLRHAVSARGRPPQRAADRPGLGGAGGADLFQLPQGVDLRRHQRDPEEHHRQGDIGIVRSVGSIARSPPRPSPACGGGRNNKEALAAGSLPRSRGRARWGRCGMARSTAAANSRGLSDGFRPERRAAPVEGQRRAPARRPLRFRAAQGPRAEPRGLEPRIVGAICRARPARPALRRGARRHRRRTGRDDDRDGGVRPRPGARTLSGDGRARRRLSAPRRQRGAASRAAAADRRGRIYGSPSPIPSGSRATTSPTSRRRRGATAPAGCSTARRASCCTATAPTS